MRKWITLFVGICMLIAGTILIQQCREKDDRIKSAARLPPGPADEVWVAPDSSQIPRSAEGELIRYGRLLIANTAFYFGPKGRIAKEANGMNCQNCHLDAGTRPFANSFAAVASTYPKYRERSGRIESIKFRINECMERSINGKKINDTCKEMSAMVAYLTWVGKGVPKGKKPKGAGAEELPFLNRAADSARGKIIYQAKCQSCHGLNGEGLLNAGQTAYVYPPLWGKHSYNVSAGLYRITKFAAYVKASMPFGASHSNPQLTDEQTWDVSAFVNAQSHPQKFFSYDWPKIETKPVDYPFGPYADGFSENQHKYGPFGPIQKAKETLKHQ